MDKKVIHIDQLLVSRVMEGDENAFEQLFDKYQTDVFRFACSLIKSKVHAQEIVQDVFVKIWVKRKTLNEKLSFKAFLFVIAKNMSYDFLVKSSRDLKLKQHVFYHATSFHMPVENYMLDQEYELLREQAINRLPSKRKRIFQMSRNEGKSYQDISEELGIATQTVKNQMSRALDNITVFLESQGGITLMIAQIVLFY